jgi:hypothetical protein
MSTVTAILEPHADGTVHLPVPLELRRGKLRVTATLQAEPDTSKTATIEAARERPLATPEMLARRRAALEALRSVGGLQDIIPDPAAWQREIRQDRPLPGRE